MKGLIFLALFALTTSANAVKDPAVATVNGKAILKSEFLKTYNQNLLYVSDKIVTKEKVLNDLINRELGIQRAKKAKLQNNPIVKSKMEDILYHAQISKELEPKLKRITVTDDDVKTYYRSNPEYRTAHILFRIRALPEKKEVEAALTQAFKVYEQLKRNPGKFAEMANKFSQSSTAPNGGDMGFQPAVRMAPEYFKAINGKSNGFISPPVRTQFGFHIIKVLAKKELKATNSALYKKIVYDQKRDAIIEQHFKPLRKSAKITIDKKHLEYTEPADSPKKSN